MVVVLDCNIWITLIINKKLDFIVQLAESGIRIASCPALKNEITDVLLRPKLKKFIAAESVEEVAGLHDLITKPYKINLIPNVVQDEKDNYLFALCAQSKADYLITGDKLLLEVKAYKKTKVITLATFKNAITTN